MCYGQQEHEQEQQLYTETPRGPFDFEGFKMRTYHGQDGSLAVAVGAPDGSASFHVNPSERNPYRVSTEVILLRPQVEGVIAALRALDPAPRVWVDAMDGVTSLSVSVEENGGVLFGARIAGDGYTQTVLSTLQAASIADFLSDFLANLGEQSPATVDWPDAEPNVAGI